VFAKQDDVSRRIVSALQLQLTPDDERRMAAAAAPASPAANLYLKGRFHLFSETRLSEITPPSTAFEKAPGAAADYALAMIGSPTRGPGSRSPSSPRRLVREGRGPLRARLAIDPEMPEGRYLRARMLWNPRKGFDHAGAMRELAPRSRAARAGRGVPLDGPRA
jgi:hypothetical protein